MYCFIKTKCLCYNVFLIASKEHIMYNIETLENTVIKDY